MRFNGESGLNPAESAHGSADRRIGINAVAGDAKMLYLINHEDAHDRCRDNSWAITAISSSVGNDFSGHGDKRAILFYAGFDFVDHDVFSARGKEFFLPAVADLDGQAA